MMTGESLWSLISLAANEPEFEEIDFLIGNKRIKENEVSKHYAELGISPTLIISLIIDALLFTESLAGSKSL